MSSVFQKDLLRPSDVAEICGVTRNTVFRWLRRGLLERVRIGGATFVKGEDLRFYLNGHAAAPTDLLSDTGDELEIEAKEMLLSFRGHRQS